MRSTKIGLHGIIVPFGSLEMYAVGSHFLTPTVPLHVFEGPEPGPTAIIQAGIHGDEVAGVHALSEWLEGDIEVARGRLLVIPVMNAPAYRARQRAAPGGLDLNRCFPGDFEGEAPETRLAHAFMQLVIDEHPALVATLHESHKRYDPEVTPSFGQTLVYGVKPMPDVIDRVIVQLNDGKSSDDESWAPQYYPVMTSSTEVIVEAVGCVGICVETWMGFDEGRRVQMQRQVVRLLLEDFGILRR
jgi:hypothetical protein